MNTLTASRARRKVTRRKTAKSIQLNLVAVIEKDRDGYFAHCPALQGCYTQGDTYDEALNNIRDAVRLHLEDRLASGEHLPGAEAMSLTMLQVQI